MTNIPFMKLSGAGNDFVIIDNLESIVPYESTDFVAKVCERRMSVGADGVLLVEKSDGADFKMRYFNADGGEAETCGNGARCISKLRISMALLPIECVLKQKPASTNRKFSSQALRCE
jgi:diaminopimelate epimerase